MKFIVGKKIGMSQVFDPKGAVRPVTFIQAGPMKVIRKKTVEKDGYEAVQVGYGTRKERRVARAQRGAWKDLGLFAHVREYRPSGSAPSLPDVGETVTVSMFGEGDALKIAGVSKSKGFQGVVKRHGFRGAPATHGTKHAHREPGSIGSGLRTRVPKGMRMGGRMGGKRVTVRGLRVVAVDPEKHVIAVSGAVPGIPGALLEIREDS